MALLASAASFGSSATRKACSSAATRGSSAASSSRAIAVRPASAAGSVKEFGQLIALSLNLAQLADGLDHRIEFGKFLRQRNIARLIGATTELDLNRLPALHQLVELFGGMAVMRVNSDRYRRVSATVPATPGERPLTTGDRYWAQDGSLSVLRDRGSLTSIKSSPSRLGVVKPTK